VRRALACDDKTNLPGCSRVAAWFSSTSSCSTWPTENLHRAQIKVLGRSATTGH
jgi:hypothetical protein